MRPTTEQLIRTGHATFAAHGVKIPHRKLVRMIRTFQNQLDSRPDDVVEDFDTYLARTYADPTGEHAIRNLSRTS